MCVVMKLLKIFQNLKSLDWKEPDQHLQSQWTVRRGYFEVQSLNSNFEFQFTLNSNFEFQTVKHLASML